MSLKPLTLETCVLRQTHAAKGRTEAMNPSTSASRWLHYGRIILDAGAAPVTFALSGRETSLIGLNGRARVTSAEGATYTAGRYDALYIPRDQGDQRAAVRRRLRPRGAVRAGRRAVCAGVRVLRADQAGPGAALPRGRSRQLARAERPDRQERRGRPPAGGRHLQRPRQLDVVAAARTRRDARRGLSLHRHAGAGVRRAVRLHRSRESRRSPRSCAKATPWSFRRATTPTSPRRAAASASSGSWPRIAEAIDRQFGVVNVQPEFAQKGSGLEAAQRKLAP